jgi:CobQ-like glutamine amidotransferase family enzyme
VAKAFAPVLTIALLYPELLGTYGDGGNALVLRERARRRGIDAVIEDVSVSEALPTAALYILGGGEDGPQRLAVEALVSDGTLGQRVTDGAVVLAVCAGLQILGDDFDVAGGDRVNGLGLIPASTRRSSTRRVGELLVDTPWGSVVGFENHGGVTDVHEENALGTMVEWMGFDPVGSGALTRTDRCWDSIHD